MKCDISLLTNRRQYLCYFKTWNGFMDGVLVIGDKFEDYDFVDINNKDTDEDNLLIPFTEDEARKHFASKGYTNVTFVYLDEEF
jgi:hypothetical protein